MKIETFDQDTGAPTGEVPQTIRFRGYWWASDALTKALQEVGPIPTSCGHYDCWEVSAATLKAIEAKNRSKIVAHWGDPSTPNYYRFETDLKYIGMAPGVQLLP